MTRTAQEIAEELGCPREAADGLLKYLKAADLARFRGERSSPTGRGKGPKVYEIVPGAGKVVGAAVRKLEPLEQRW